MRPLCEETFPTSIPREASGGAGINNSHVRWTQVPLLSSLPHTGLMDTAIILPKRRRLFWTRRDGQMHSCSPKKHRCVFWARSSLRGQGLYSVDPPCFCDKMKETNNICHTAAITGTVKWKSQERAGSKVKSLLFVISLHSLWDAVNRCRRCLFVRSPPPRNQKGTWKPCFDVSFRHILSLICLINSTLWEGNCHNPNNESQKKRQENCALKAAALNRVWARYAERVSDGGSRDPRAQIVEIVRALLSAFAR